MIDTDENATLSRWLKHTSNMAIDTRLVLEESRVVEEAKRMHDMRKLVEASEIELRSETVSVEKEEGRWKDFSKAVARYEDFAEAMRKKLLREITYRPKVSNWNRQRSFCHFRCLAYN